MVYEYYLIVFCCVKFVVKLVFSCFCDFIIGDDECMVNKYVFVDFGVKNFMFEYY